MTAPRSAFRCADLCVCGGDSEVTETRASGENLRRRRRCVACRLCWTTYEWREARNQDPAIHWGASQ